VKRLAGAVLLALLLALGWAKAQAGLLPEMLWMCHVASGALALGLLFDWAGCSAVGFLIHLAVGVPAYLLHLARGGDTTWVSFLLHLLSPLFGWLAWRGRALPRMTALLGLACYAALVALCLLVTPEALNVNLSFKPWAPVATASAWVSRAGNALLMLVLLVGVQWLLNRRRQV
jgi:hypothetical protein